MRTSLLIVAALAFGLGAAAGAFGLWRGGHLVGLRASISDTRTKYERGERVAEALGCFACHGPGGRAGTTNFLPDIDEVPSWSRWAIKSYVANPAELEEWILDGLPKRMRDDPQEHARVQRQLIRMPAYRGLVEGEDLEALVHYLLSTSTLLPQEEETPAAKGRDTAARLGCFGCHGGEGRGTVKNPGSFKGYIPAWDSSDFEELVRSRQEFDEWVKKGAPTRLSSHPVASRLFERQAIRMPAYEQHVTPQELDELWAYVTSVRARR